MQTSKGGEKMKKVQYEELEAEVICFENIDVITESDPNQTPIIGG